ncbi:phenylalanine--tRNA ligase subunit alpha [bacterium]|nr:phenylalanine--tRNA ligase subunit alpha [bacterium]
MEYEIESVKQLARQLEDDIPTLKLEDLQSKYMGKNGLLKQLLTDITNQSDEQKRTYGREANLLKHYFTERVSQLSSHITIDSSTEKIDPTAPFDINTPKANWPKVKGIEGTMHPLMQEMEHVLKIFQNMGFEIVESKQLDDDYHMFESLNIPKGHPARDIWDTFWTDDDLIPPAHTSTMQNRVMKERKPPIRVIVPGRCYRNEATDASHEHTFYQIEGVYVDKNISLGDMLGTIKTYLEAFFEMDLEIKVQPAYFPFVEPGCEFMISCPFCKKTGCSVCGYDGWMEIMGCGMIHPNVLKEAGIDPEEYTGFAWGFGLDRLVMIKHSIADIRRLHSGDLNFLKQF